MLVQLYGSPAYVYRIKGLKWNNVAANQHKKLKHLAMVYNFFFLSCYRLMYWGWLLTRGAERTRISFRRGKEWTNMVHAIFGKLNKEYGMVKYQSANTFHTLSRRPMAFHKNILSKCQQSRDKVRLPSRQDSQLLPF